MQTVSDKFLKAFQDRHSRKAIGRIEYKRRFFNGSIFVLEAATNILELDEVINVPAINMKLDPGTGKILSSNLTLLLRNERNKWVPTNITDGVFKPDAIAPLGYDPFRMQFVVKYGYVFPDGTEEFVTLFTGEAKTPRFNSTNNRAQFFITGREIRMLNADAQQVNTTLVAEATTPTAGDGANKEFLGEESIFDMQQVRVAAAVVDQGSRWKIEDQNDAEKFVKITIDPAPLSLEAVDYNARQWRRNIQVSTLVGLLCDEAGVLLADRDIEEPNYPDVSQFQIINTKAQWDAGLQTRVESESLIDSLTYGDEVLSRDFETDDAFATGWESGGVNGSSTRIEDGTAQKGVGHLLLESTGTEGSITFVVEVINVSGVVVASKLLGGFGVWTLETIDAPVAAGSYGLRFSIKSGATTLAFSQLKSSERNGLPLVRFSFYYQAGSNFVPGFGPTTKFFRIDNIRAIPDVDGVFESDGLDLLAAPTAWGKLVVVETLGGGTSTYKTATSDDDITYTAFVPLLGDGTIDSPFKRFIKVESTYTPNAGRTDGPVVAAITVNFVSSTLFVGHADFSGKKVFGAIQRIAEITDMEFGFSAVGRFFFRNKPVSPISVLTMDQSSIIEAVRNLDPGFDNVINVAQVRYGAYYSEKSSITEGEASPTSIERFGRKIQSKTISDFLFANNANFAEAIAGIVYTNKFSPLRRIILDCRLFPALEPGDVVTASFFDSEHIEEASFGDEQNPEPAFGENTNVLFRETLFKLVGFSPNIFSGKMMLQGVEVLT